VRLLGVSVSQLSEGAARQLSLDDLADGGSNEGWHDASKAIDEIRRRYGDEAIAPAALRGRHGIRVKRGAISSGVRPARAAGRRHKTAALTLRILRSALLLVPPCARL